MISKELEIISSLHNEFIEHFTANYLKIKFNEGGCGFVADAIYDGFMTIVEGLNLKNLELKIVLASMDEGSELNNTITRKDNKKYIEEKIAIEEDIEKIEDLWCENVSFVHVLVKVKDVETLEEFYFDNQNMLSKDDLMDDFFHFISYEFKDNDVFDKVLKISGCWNDSFDFQGDKEIIQESIYDPINMMVEIMLERKDEFKEILALSKQQEDKINNNLKYKN